MFNRKKKLVQHDKIISLTLFKIPTKYDTILLIHVFKTNLFILQKKKKHHTC